MPLPATLRRNIHLSHAKQLAQLQLPSEPKVIKNLEPPSHLLQIIVPWILDNKEAIKAAQDSQCTSTSPDSPNWDTVLFSLVESITMYLRNYSHIVAASEAARLGDFEKAADYLEQSQEEIDQVASLLDCTFLQLCDFVTQSPDGFGLQMSGAFCGLFISNNTEKPFMGVAYKGTSVDPEDVTDILWRPITSPARPDVAWGAPMHEGFYRGLFDTYTTEGIGPQVPFGRSRQLIVDMISLFSADLMLHTLSDAYASHPNAQLHFTGHSMGGAYCIITYGEFLRRQAEPAFTQFKFGDMYAYAAPRVCYEPFATEMRRCIQDADGTKCAFRIVNMQDPVTTAPPAFDFQLDGYPFVHPGSAWRITLDGPEKMSDEPPQVPPAPDRLQDDGHFHDPQEYYASWQKTLHS